ncbi:MAG: TadE family protein [Bdellovibrionota bacterium]
MSLRDRRTDTSAGIRARAEAGVAIVEFALVIPFILGLVFFATEVARYMKIAQLATAVAHEAANEAYRHCADIPARGTLGALQSATNTCVTDRVTSVLRSAVSNNFPGGDKVELIVRVERFDGAFQELASVSTNPTKASRYTFAADGSQLSQNGGTLLTDLQRRGRIVTAEVFYPLNSWIYQIPFLGGVLFHNIVDAEEYYAAAVL